MAPPFAKLVKLRIFGYDRPERTGEGKSLEVMFNPQSFSQTFSNRYSSRLGYRKTAQTAHFRGVGIADLSLSLLFDGTARRFSSPSYTP